jgi:hypothetical protein
VIPSSIRVVRPVKLGAPYQDDLREALKKDQFDLLIQFRNPVFEVGVTLQIQAIDLTKAFSQVSSNKKSLTHSSLDLIQQFRERFGGIRTSRKIIYRP